MTTPINLNRARKARVRAAKRKAAETNAVKFGRTKAEKAVDQAERDREQAHLDGHERDKT